MTVRGRASWRSGAGTVVNQCTSSSLVIDILGDPRPWRSGLGFALSFNMSPSRRPRIGSAKYNSDEKPRGRHTVHHGHWMASSPPQTNLQEKEVKATAAGRQTGEKTTPAQHRNPAAIL